MYRKLAACLFTVLGLMSISPSISAAIISFTASPVVGNQWVYDYTVTAAVGDPTIDEFTIYFDPMLYANLAVAASPGGWDSIVIQPDSAIPADGFFDSLALVAGIGPGVSQGGFSVSFDFLGTGTPGTQAFDIVDPITFAVLASGSTSTVSSPPPIVTVLEPGTFVLVCIGFTLLLVRVRAWYPKKQQDGRAALAL